MVLKALSRLAIGLLKLLVVLVTLSTVILYWPGQDARFRPSPNPAYIPQAEDSFASYVEKNRLRIHEALSTYFYDLDPQPFGANYPIDLVVQMRSPYQLTPSNVECSQQQTKQLGFLLVHGLSDSPYLLKPLALSLQKNYPCALIRGLLSPGHSTVPGDLLNVSRSDWLSTFDWAVSGFKSEVDSLLIVGYSNGAALALNHLDRHRGETLIKGLISLSPGLNAKDERAFLSPYIKYFAPWINKDVDTDAVKYQSFPMNAAAEFYRLGMPLIDASFSPLKTPLLMFVSSDDSTVDNQTSVDFFCKNSSLASHENSASKLIWYQSAYTQKIPLRSCAGLNIRMIDNSNPRFISSSHVSLSMPEDDVHYGVNGYAVCLAYKDDAQRFSECVHNDSATVYAENNLADDGGLLQGKLVRRSTFNPAYDAMLEDIRVFINSLFETQGI